jgi:hypothetical protein
LEEGEHFLFSFLFMLLAFGLLPFVRSFVRSLFLLSRSPFSFLMRFYEPSADSVEVQSEAHANLR